MNSLTLALKAEMARVARRELKDELLALRKAVAAHRAELASLKREIKALRSAVKLNAKVVNTVRAGLPEVDRAAAGDSGPRLRFSAKGFAARRARLGLSQAQMARLLGVSGLSVYKWETGKVQPRAAQLQRIAAIRKLGKREVAARLAQA